MLGQVEQCRKDDPSDPGHERRDGEICRIRPQHVLRRRRTEQRSEEGTKRAGYSKGRTSMSVMPG